MDRSKRIGWTEMIKVFAHIRDFAGVSIMVEVMENDKYHKVCRNLLSLGMSIPAVSNELVAQVFDCQDDHKQMYITMKKTDPTLN